MLTISVPTLELSTVVRDSPMPARQPQSRHRTQHLRRMALESSLRLLTAYQWRSSHGHPKWNSRREPSTRSTFSQVKVRAMVVIDCHVVGKDRGGLCDDKLRYG